MSDWLKALSETLVSDKVPKGFLTRQEVAKEMGKGIHQTDIFLKRLVSANKAEKKSFRVQTGAGIRPVPHYRLK